MQQPGERHPRCQDPAESSVYQVLLDADGNRDNFLLFAVLVLAVELELGAELDDVALTDSCPKIYSWKESQ